MASSTLSRRSFSLIAVSAVGALGLAGCGSSDDSSSSESDSDTSADDAEETDEDSAEETESEEEAEDSDTDETSDDAISADNHTIVFEATSDSATKADITITSADANGNLQQEQLTDEPLPFSKTVELDGSIVFDITAANMMAQAKDGEDIAISMTIDDNEPVTADASGLYATAAVQGSN